MYVSNNDIAIMLAPNMSSLCVPCLSASLPAMISSKINGNVNRKIVIPIVLALNPCCVKYNGMKINSVLKNNA